MSRIARDCPSMSSASLVNEDRELLGLGYGASSASLVNEDRLELRGLGYGTTLWQSST